jgi:hypothetical protein
MIKAQTMDHNFHGADSRYAFISLLGLLLKIISIGAVVSYLGGAVAIVSGLISITINFPKFKHRILQIFKRN